METKFLSRSSCSLHLLQSPLTTRILSVNVLTTRTSSENGISHISEVQHTYADHLDLSSVCGMSSVLGGFICSPLSLNRVRSIHMKVTAASTGEIIFDPDAASFYAAPSVFTHAMPLYRLPANAIPLVLATRHYRDGV